MLLRALFFLSFLYQAGRDTKRLKEQEEEEKQKNPSLQNINSFLEMNSVFIILFIFLKAFECYQENHQAL